MRLFTAIALPDDVAQSLSLMQSGIPGARWMTREQLHLTLRFIGEVDGRDARVVDDALMGISAPAFALELYGTGQFGGRTPHALWVGVRANEALMHLQRKIESALQRFGLPPDPRKFVPHVTLARLKNAPAGRVMDYLAGHSLCASRPFDIGAFILYSSVTSPSGSIYRAEKAYPLKAE